MDFKNVLFLISLFSIMNILYVECDEEPKVTTKYGKFVGKIMKSRNGRDYSAFLGIPYAKPPIGNLRFMEAEPLDESDDLISADKPGNDCVQDMMSYNPETKKLETNDSVRGSEDCLYLNIYVPKLEKENSKLPVMIYIHGGGYVLGSGSPDYNGPKLFMDRNLIMVAINFRLSILGFLSASDDIPENVGMKDQVLALKWVKDNIGDFGGDPDAITLAGISAGGSSVTMHLHSKLSKGLFQRAIAQSGTLYNPWALRSKLEARTVGSKIIDYLGCSTEPSQLLKCLQDMPLTKLFKAVNALKRMNLLFYMTLSPVIEQNSPSAFVTKESIAESSTTPLLAGMTNEEGLVFYHQLILADPSYKELIPMKSNAETYLPILSYYPESPNKENITSELINYYVDNQWSKENMNGFIKMLSDTTFNHGLHLLAKNYKGALYQYLWSFIPQGAAMITLRPPGFENSVTHGNDYLYTMHSTLIPFNLTEKDVEFSNHILDLWSNFVTYGNPTPKEKSWKESNGGDNYLEFTNDGDLMKSNLFKERMDFLDKIHFNDIF